MALKNITTTRVKKSIIQLTHYFCVGAVAAAVNFAFLFLFTDVFHIYYLISNVLAFTAALTVNYLLCKKFIFTQNIGNKKMEFLIYVLIGIVGLAFDTALLYVFTNFGGRHYLVSKVASTAIVFVWNFGARKTLYYIKR